MHNDLIYEQVLQSYSTEKFETHEYLTRYFLTRGKNIFLASEMAENNLQNFVEYANRIIQICTLRNIQCMFLNVSKDIVIKNCNFSVVTQIHSKLNALDWRDFELISADILEVCFGAVNVNVTQATADGGLDFYGTLPINIRGFSSRFGSVEIYGQSKRYTGNVGIEDMKSFEAFANSKKRNFEHTPQLFVFFTTSDYAPAARQLAETHSFIALCGLQLANLIFAFQTALSEKSQIIRRLFST